MAFVCGIKFTPLDVFGNFIRIARGPATLVAGGKTNT